MSKPILMVLMALALTACQSSGEKSDPPQFPKPGRQAEQPEGSGRLFESFFRKKPPKAILLPPDLLARSNDSIRENYVAADQVNPSEVLPKVALAAMVTQEGNRHVRVKLNPQATWDRLLAFWAGLEVDLVENQPAAGLMETDWIDANGLSEEDGGFSFARVFRRITGAGVLYDKYQIRLERESDAVTRVFVNHRSTERVIQDVVGYERDGEFEWVSGQNPEKVAQLLQLLVLLFDETEDSV